MKFSPNPPSRAQAELMSKGESRRLVLLAGLLLVGLYYVFLRPHQPLPDPSEGPEIAVAPTTVDAKHALELFQRLEAERAGLAPVPSAARVVADPAVLARVTDGEPLDEVEEEAFYQLVAQVHGMSDAEVEAAPLTSGTWTWEGLHSEAGRVQARGKFATVRGRFFTPLFQRVLARYPNEAGLAWVWQGTLRVHNRGFFVTITDKSFEPQYGPSAEPVELTGAFLKVHRFRPVATDLGEVMSYPHLVARTVRKLPPGSIPQKQAPVAGPLLVVVCLVSALVMYLYVRSGRKGEAQFDAWRADRVRKGAREALKARLDAAALEAQAVAAAPPSAAPPSAAPPSAAPPSAAPPSAAPPSAAPPSAAPPSGAAALPSEPPPSVAAAPPPPSATGAPPSVAPPSVVDAPSSVPPASVVDAPSSAAPSPAAPPSDPPPAPPA